MKSVNSIGISEINGSKTAALESEKPQLHVSEHWNRRDLVIIDVGGTKYTVDAGEIKRAIDNAQNAHPW